jgi:hypothetical protein
LSLAAPADLPDNKFFRKNISCTGEKKQLWDLCKVICKGGYPKKMWCSVGSPSSIRRRTLKSSKWEFCRVR